MKKRVQTIVETEIVYEVHVENLRHPDNDFNPNMIVRKDLLMGTFSSLEDAKKLLEKIRKELVGMGYYGEAKSQESPYWYWLWNCNSEKFKKSHPFCAPVSGGWKISVKEKEIFHDEQITEEVLEK